MGEGGRPHVARLADPRRDAPRWQALDPTVEEPPVAVEGEGGAVHLLADSARAGLWHARLGAGGDLDGAPRRIAERVAGGPVGAVDRERRLLVAFGDGSGTIRLLTLGHDGRTAAAARGAPDGTFATALAVVDDEAEGLLLAALDREDRAAVWRPGDPKVA